MQKARAVKFPGTMTWTGTAWFLRVRKQQGSLKIERERTIEGRADAPPHVELDLFKREVAAEWALLLSGRASDRPTCGTWATPWLESLATKGASAAYVKTRGLYMRDLVLPFFGHLEPEAVKPRDIEAYKGWLLACRQQDGEPYAHGTMLTVFRTARQFLRYVVVQADLPRDPTHVARFDVIASDDAPEKDVLDAEELRALMEAGRALVDEGRMGPDMLCMIAVGFGLGLRFSELSAALWEHVDLDAGTMRVVRSQYGGIVGRRVKTKATRRVVPLPPEVVAWLRDHRAWQMREQVPGFELGIVFPSNVGTYRFPQVLAKPLALMCERAGIDKHLTSHCLRHTANNLLREVASGIVVRAMIGHSAERMTERYSHVHRREKEQAQAAAFKGALRPVLGADPQ